MDAVGRGEWKVRGSIDGFSGDMVNPCAEEVDEFEMGSEGERGGEGVEGY